MQTNWQTRKLGEICDFEGGSQPPKSNFVHEPRKGYVRFLQIRDFGSDKYITYIPDSKKNRHCDEDDILLGRYGASVGKILVNRKGAYNVAVMKTMPNLEMIDKSYFYYYLISDEFQKPLSKVADRSAQAGFSKDDIYNFSVLTPPISEQRRIVKILNEVFEKVTKAKKNAEKNLQNAKELFESYLQSVFANSSKNWEEKALGEVCNFVQGVQVDAPLQNEVKKENQVRFLRIIDFTQGNELPRYIDNPGEKYIISVNDVSLVRYGASTGFVCRGLSGVLANNLFRAIPKNSKQISNEYLFIFLKSPVFQNIIKKAMGGVAMPAISFGLVKDIPIPVASLLEQKAIVKKLDALSIKTKKLEKIYEQKLADLEELKKSVLKKAFDGDL